VIVAAAGDPPDRRRFVGGRPVFGVGYGAMALSYPGRPDPRTARSVIHAALDAGIDMIDTADVYCPTASSIGANERLVAAALREWHGDRNRVLVATKGGHIRNPDYSIGRDGRPDSLRRACEASLRALDVERIDLYYLHSPDPAVPFLESVGAMVDLQATGKIAMVGLSNVTTEHLDAAATVVDVACVENRYSPFDRRTEACLTACTERSIPYVTWGLLGRGADDYEGTPVAEIAAGRGVSPQRVVIAWALQHSPQLIPLPGARRREHVLDCVAGAELVLDHAEICALDDIWSSRGDELNRRSAHEHVETATSADASRFRCG